jgi:fumarate hydratase class II
MRPIIINNVLHSARILGDACEQLRRYSIAGTELERDQDTEDVRAAKVMKAIDLQLTG